MKATKLLVPEDGKRGVENARGKTSKRKQP
jgi:hypothetical protein